MARGCIPGRAGLVLQLSMRKLDNLVAYSLVYEFEDTVAGLTTVGLSARLRVVFSGAELRRSAVFTHHHSRLAQAQPCGGVLHHDRARNLSA